MDFAENFLCKYQNEVQSVYWSYNQVTVHPCVLHYACPDCSKQVTDYVIFFSDDLKHDPHIVKRIQAETIQHLKTSVTGLEKVVIFSDPTHYKSKLPFHHLGSENWGVDLERCFFGSRHGKSECDAAGSIKRVIEDDILTGATIQNASDMYQYCTEHHTLPEELNESCCHTKRSFRLIQAMIIM